MFTNVDQKKLSVFCLLRGSRRLFLFSLFFIGALTACDGAKTGLTEELAVLPNSNDKLVSEFSWQGASEGRIALLHAATGQRRTLYSSISSNDLKVRPAIWGDFNCDEPQQFSPQGFDLAQRPSGRWQLLVVNQAVKKTVEMFELQKNATQHWQLIWRGCVEIPVQNSFNDVEALSDGFTLQRTPSVQATLLRWVKNLVGRNTETQWRWRLRDGFQLVVVSQKR